VLYFYPPNPQGGVYSVFFEIYLHKSFRGCLKSLNPLTAEFAKIFRKGCKELIYNILTLHTLRLLSVLCG